MSCTAYRWVMTEVGQPLKQEEVSFDQPAAGEVTVAVAGCGVCHTDLGFLYDGVRTNHELPLTLGHEISGRVIATGPGMASLQDKAVVIPAVIPCGQCELCQRGLKTICRHQKMPGNDIHGGFASHITVPGHCLCEVDEQALDRVGLNLADVAVLADAVTTPYQAVVQAGIQPGDVAIVIGAGGVGSYAVQIANAMGAHVIAIDVDDTKLKQLNDYGARLTLNVGDSEIKETKKAIRAFVEKERLRNTEWKIFECSGTAAGQETAFGLLTYGAHIAVVGFTMAKIPVRLSNLMAFHATARGNWGCSPDYYPDALRLVLENKVKMQPFIQQHPLGQINEIFAAAHDHKLNARAILVPEP